MENVIKIYPYGTKVRILTSKEQGQIIAAIIEQTKVNYSIFYFDKNNGNYVTVNIGEELFVPVEKEVEQQQIGFK